MKCEEAQELMINYVSEQTLPPKLDKHIQSCIHCKSWFLEIQEMTEIWEQAEPEPGLDLNTPVMNYLESHKPIYQVFKHQVFHFSIAASIALFMFHFGVFEQSGWNILQTIDLVSHKMQAFANHVSDY